MSHVSTSFHHLNADRRLSAAGKAAYFVCNWINNQLPGAFVDPGLEVRDFVYRSLAADWPALPRGASPSRTLCDLFWRSLPWAAIRQELRDIRLLDVGCGTGRYGPDLMAWSAGRISSYTGVDVRADVRWQALEAGDSRLRFLTAPAERFRDAIPAGTTLLMSQSAIEHFDEDLTFFRQIRDYSQTVDGPMLQVHLMPSQACLLLYHLHGVRQYTPRTLSKITKLFADDSRSLLFRLGGAACNRAHFEFITRPYLFHGKRDRRDEEPEAYDRALFAAIEEDMRHPQASPAFYALVIHSRPKVPLF